MLFSEISKHARRAIRSPLSRLYFGAATSVLIHVAAQAAEPAPVADNPTADSAVEVDQLIVTGSRGVARTVAESPAPIDVISSEKLQLTGRSEFGEALGKLLPSFNFATNSAGISSIVRPVTNRGLGPAYTLVLVNGKRRHNGAQITNGSGDNSGVNPVDLDLVPLSAVRSIEVLKDSAAAQYGSDAVAGVINVQLKRGAKGGHVGITAGSLYDGYGDLETYKAEADFGLALGDRGFVHFSADARKRGLAWWNFAASNKTIYAPASNAKNATWSGDGAHNGDPEIKAFNLAYNAEYELGEETVLYSFATYGERDTVIGNNFRRPNETASFTWFSPDGYYPLNNTAEYDFQVVAGGRGVTAGWRWDASTSYGKNRVRQYSDYTINPSLGRASPTRFDNLATYQFEQWTQNLDVTRGFDLGLAKPVQVSWGAEYRTDKFSTFAGDPLGYANGGYVIQAGDQEGDPNVGKLAAIGAQAAITLRPQDEARLTRNVVAGYLDLGIYPAETWYVGAAVRVEHNDDSSGDTVGGKLNSRWDVTERFAIRGTVGSGFRAPSLSQLGYAQTDNRTALINNVLVPSLSYLARNGSTLAKALGASDLKPEKSWNLGLGAVWRPLDDVSVTIDGYRVVVEDRIIRTSLLYGPTVRAALVANGFSGTEYVAYFTNAVDTTTTGVDLVAETKRDLGRWGGLNLSAAFNYNKTKLDRIAATPSAVGTLDSGFYYFGRDRQGELTVGNPQTKWVLSGRWSLGKLGVNLQTARYGGVTWQRSQDPAQDVKYGAKWITDLDVGFAVTEQLRVSVGAVNLFDVRPDANGPGDAKTGVASSVYGPSPFAPSGGFYYGKIAYDF